MAQHSNRTPSHARQGGGALQSFAAALETRSYYLVYTVLFAVAALASYALLFADGLSFVWSTDGATQHMPALLYLREWIASSLQSIASGDPAVSTWDMSIGMGGDMISTLSHYGLGDVLNLIALAFPSAYVGVAFTGIAILRLYLSGVAFSLFARCFDVRGYAVLLAAMLYALSGFSLFMVLRHPHFIDALVYLPLICLGAEKVLHRESPVLFIGAFWFMFCANFYFSYMVFVYAIGYVICRLCMRGGYSVRDVIVLVAKFFAFGIVAACLAAPILLPTVAAVLESSRGASGGYVPMLYEPAYYLELLPTFSTLGFAGAQCYIGITQFGVLAVLFLFLQRGRQARVLKVACIVLVVSILIPWTGHAMNGFSYAANRHSFGLVFFACGLVAWLLPRLFSADAGQQRALAVMVAVYALGLAASAAYSIASGEAEGNFGSAGALLYVGRAALVVLALSVTLLVIRAVGKRPAGSARAKAVLCALTVVFVMVNGAAMSFVYHNLMLSFADTERLVTEDSFANAEWGKAGEAAAAPAGDEQTFDSVYRFDSGSLTFGDEYAAKPVTHANSGLADGRFYDSAYFSLTPRALSDFLSGEMELGGYSLSGIHYWDLDNRATILDLLSVRYWAGEKELVPYGFAQVAGKPQGGYDEEDEPCYAENAHAVPFGFTYDAVIDRADYDALGAIDKQEALMVAGAVEDANDPAFTALGRTSGVGAAKALSVSAATEGTARIASDATGPLEVGTGEDDATLILEFDPVKDVELYVELSGFSPEPDAQGTMIARAKSRHGSGWCRFAPPGEQAYSNYNSGMLFLGYSDEERSKVKVALPADYDYSFDSVRVWALPLADHRARADALAAESLHDVSVGANGISGSITVSKPKLLCLSIPFSQGWSAAVDDSPANLVRVNTGMMGLVLDAGDHDVQLRYVTPGLHLGIALFACGLVALVAMALVSRRRSRA